PTQTEKAIAVLDTALLKGEDAIDEARDAVSDLRSLVKIEPDFDFGLSGIASQIAKTRNHDLTPSWELRTIGEARQIPALVLYDLYQLAQEALSNAFRHAAAQRIKIEVEYGDAALRVSFVDDGVGFDESILGSHRRQGHWGLLGMKERVEKLGGRLSLRSQ